MASLSSALSNLSCMTFLATYPHPAFILHAQKAYGQVAAPLNPIFGNTPFRLLVFGPDAETAELGVGFLRALRTVKQAEALADWLVRGRKTGVNPGTLLLSVTPSWTSNNDVVELELTQTALDGFVVCTSTPRSPLPTFTPAMTPESAPSLANRRGYGSAMQLSGFPPPKSSRPSSRSPTSSRSPPDPHTKNVLSTPSTSIMRDMINNHPWHLTPLGPRSKWSTSLNTVVNYILDSPFPKSIWWGPDVVLLYNDAYREMAGSKHPQIFGEKGSVSWGELWEDIGPLAHQALSGKAVAKTEDLLFFNRLTGANLPEEVYHNWSFVPVKDDDGSYGGILNVSFDTTSKVLAERRFLFLRDLGNQAAMARSQTEFWSAVMDVVRPFSLDVPFAAFYFVSTNESVARSYRGPRTSYIHGSADAPPINVQLRRVGAIGIPDSHHSAPPYIEVRLDSLTLLPSPESKAQNSNQLSPENPGATPAQPSEYKNDTGYLHELFSTPVDGRVSPFMRNASVSGFSSDTVVQKNYHSHPHDSVFWPFEEAFATRRAVLMDNISDYVVEGFEIRGWGEPARQAVVIPIYVDNNDLPAAIVVMGLNSRRPYDKDYSDWIDLTRLSLNSLLTAVKGREADAIRAEHLSELDRAKTSFFSNASHELRTPLTLIQGPLNDCIAQVENKKVKETLKMASRNVVRLSRLVDSLMDFSKLAANRLEGRFRPVRLGPFTADLASLFRSVIEKTSIEYIVECDMNDERHCYIDPDFWEKIVFNLIGNAFKYTMKGAIRVVVEYDRDNAYLHVKDTGVGIPESDVDKVFDRFHRVDSISRSHEGTGIGLALTKELVKLHGGLLSVRSKPETEHPDDHGSVFTVTLPLGRDHLPAAHIVVDLDDSVSKLTMTYAQGVVDEATQWDSRVPEERTPSESSDSGSSSEGRKIDPATLFFAKNDIVLLVDDNADMRRYMSSLLAPYCKVAEATNGKDALRKMETVHPNLIVSDVMMPVLDGYGLIQRIRQRAETKLTPIILVTARESEENKVEGLLSGADDYISKPFAGKELIARVHLQMQLGKRRIELEERFAERTREIQLLSDLSPVGILRVNETGRIVYTNSKWWEISGHEREAPEEDWIECVEEGSAFAISEIWKSALNFQQGSSVEFRFKNGKFAKASFEPLFADNGTPRGMLATLTDVSDQRLLEAASLQHAQEREGAARRRAEEAEERRVESDERRSAQELLIDVTSHELRQPVSAILNCSSLVRENLALLRDNLKKALEKSEGFHPSTELMADINDDIEALDSIYQCGLAQERIANDVLSLSRIQLQVLTIQKVEFDVIEEVKMLAGVFKNELKMKHIKLSLHFAESFQEIGSRVSSDKARFMQVITNLISNAIKFTDTSPGKREIEIAVDASRYCPASDAPCLPPDAVEKRSDLASDPHDVYVFVSVKDSGPGIAPEDLALLFQRFQQGSYSHKVFGGSGLGLFVSRKLCDLLGGRIEVDSVFGEGATFRFFITAHLPVSAPKVWNSLQGSSAPTPKPLRLSTEPLHVLLTEDNIINQRVLFRQLKQVGCVVEVASNGLQSLEAIRNRAKSKDTERRSFDVILMDCEMPVMDGLTAVRELRKLEASGELPSRNRVIALTGNARAGQVQSARDAGMDDVIIKPYKLDELIKIIRMHD